VLTEGGPYNFNLFTGLAVGLPDVSPWKATVRQKKYMHYMITWRTQQPIRRSNGWQDVLVGTTLVFVVALFMVLSF
jgi:hypothetical protein